VKYAPCEVIDGRWACVLPRHHLGPHRNSEGYCIGLWVAMTDAEKLPDEWEHSAELELNRKPLTSGDIYQSKGKVAVYRMCARELRAALAGKSSGYYGGGGK
jgi:hypothetical protein